MPTLLLSNWLFLLIVIPLVAGTVWLHRHSLAGMPPARARACLTVRLALLALLTVALAGPTLSLPARELQVLFLLDRSASATAAAREQALQLVREAVRMLPAYATAGVLVFGRDARVETTPASTQPLRRIASQVEADGTDLAAAIRLGAAYLPPEVQRRLVLISDGNSTKGDAATEAALTGTSGVQVDVVPVEYQLDQEGLLERLVAPERARKGEPLELRVVARSTTALPGARLRLLRDGALVADEAWSLKPGVNVLDLSQTLQTPGFHTWEALLTAPGDTVPDNNRALSFTRVLGKPLVALVEGKPGDAETLATVLRGQSIEAERLNVGQIPGSRSELQRFDAIALVNVRADQVSAEQMKLLRDGVRDLGVGLLMVGGEDSLTAGGWRGTPVEEALPVEMRVQRRPRESELALVLVIDHSGSMGSAEVPNSKLANAKQASQAAVSALRPDDELGVIAFAGEAEWASPLGKVGNGNRPLDGIASIGGGGGTNMYPALAEAQAALSRSTAAVKHILVLTDGRSSGGDFAGIARRLARERVTLSTVGVGADADGKLLGSLATLTGGRYYPAARPEALSPIFDREVRLASKAALVEEPFRPTEAEASAELRGLPAPPTLLGYVATVARTTPGVQVPLRTHRGDPLLAHWQYGLGRGVVVATDAKARWSAPWLANSGGYFSKFWSQVVRATLRAAGDEGLTATVTLDGSEGHVAVEAVTPNGEYRNGLELHGRVAGAEGGGPVRLEQTAPGRYEGRFPAEKLGQYLVSVSEPPNAAGERPKIVVAGAAAAYSPEYRALATNGPQLLEIAARSGGQAWPALGPALHRQMLPRFFRPAKPARSTPRELWPYLALAGALLLPVDIGLRRVLLNRTELPAALAATPVAALIARVRQPRPTQSADPALARLREARQRAGVRSDNPSASSPETPLPRSETILHSEGVSREASPAILDASPPVSASEGEQATTNRLLNAKRRASRRHDPQG